MNALPSGLDLDMIKMSKGMRNQKSNDTYSGAQKKIKMTRLWSKWPISDLMFYNIKMPPSSCPLGFSLLLTGALKWGTVQTSTSTHTGILKV